jgi:hypothetical protein
LIVDATPVVRLSEIEPTRLGMKREELGLCHST